MKPIHLRIAEELGVREPQVAAAISLLDGGATVPFVARYRKEAVEDGGPTLVQLVQIPQPLLERTQLGVIERPGRLRIGIRVYARAGPSTGSHARPLLDQIESPLDVGFLRVEPASKREQFGRVIDTVGDDWGLQDEGTKLPPRGGATAARGPGWPTCSRRFAGRVCG